MATSYYKGRPTRVPPKDPEAEITYGFDWEEYLDGSTILSSVWLGGDLTVEADTFDNTTTAVKLSGGEVGETYTVTNRITFTGANGTETDDRSMIIPVREL